MAYPPRIAVRPTMKAPVHYAMGRVFLCLLPVAIICGAVAHADAPLSGDALREAFINERRAMAEERRSLEGQHGGRSSEAYREARMEWRQQNAARIAGLNAMAEQIASESPPPERPPITLEQYEERMPEGLSPALRALMIERFHMRQARTAAALDEPGLSDEQRADRRLAFVESQQERGQRIQTLSRQVAAESAAQPRPEPPPVGAWHPPEGIPEAMRLYMSERHKLRRQAWEYGQTLTDKDPTARQEAVRQWRRERLEPLHALRQQAHEAMRNISGPVTPESGGDSQ